MTADRRSVLLVSHDTRHDVHELAAEVARALRDSDVDVRVCDDDGLAGGETTDWIVVPADEEAADGAELVVVLGGDGTILRGAEPTDDPVRVAQIGLGVKGGQHIRAAGSRKSCKVLAVCDVYKPHLQKGIELSGNPEVRAYNYVVGNPQIVFEDDFETDQGWTVGSPTDDATTGIWERA
ncbi:MAG: NAD(+)/NADH kinase, partial [Candidatus Nanopelagicales bacterium]